MQDVSQEFSAHLEWLQWQKQLGLEGVGDVEVAVGVLVEVALTAEVGLTEAFLGVIGEGVEILEVGTLGEGFLVPVVVTGVVYQVVVMEEAVGAVEDVEVNIHGKELYAATAFLSVYFIEILFFCVKTLSMNFVYLDFDNSTFFT